MIAFQERFEEFCAALGEQRPFAGGAPPATLAEFLNQLGSLPASELPAAVRFLAKYKPPTAVPALLALLGCDSAASGDSLLPEGVAQEIAQAIATMGGREAATGLLKCLAESPLPASRMAAAYGLTWLFDPLAFPALLQLLRDTTAAPELRAQAAEGLIYLLRDAELRPAGRAAAIDAFLAGLDDPHPAVRYWSIYAAGNLGLTSALPKLRVLVGTSDFEACDLASSASSAADVDEPFDSATLAAAAAEAVDMLETRSLAISSHAKSA